MEIEQFFKSFNSFEGRIKFVTIRPNGDREDTGFQPNTVTNAGVAAFMPLIGASFKYLAVTADTTIPAVTDTVLTGEITTGGLGRSLGTVSYVNTTVTNDTLNVYYQFTCTATNTIAKAGLFNASSGGILGANGLRKVAGVPTPTTVNAGDLFQLTYQIQGKTS